jgi:CheY-like chemotaxis protein/two-component sensor histidine kinase
MEAIGNLAGGIAHDFNNILSPIIGFSEILIEELPSDRPEHEYAQEIYIAGKRGSDLVKQILAFSRQSDHAIMPVRIAQVLKEVLKLSRSTIPSNINIVEDITDDCRPVLADATQLHQIAMNLITNAYHAVETAGGQITVRLKETVLGKNISAESPIEPGSYAVLTVSDTGCGINPAILNRIYDPYFTTKEQGKGTGLGLAVVYGIVKKHGGDIKVHSELGKGTTFDVLFPQITKNYENSALKTVEPLESGSERILLVDDEEPIARLEKQILERLGYRVTMRTSSVEALEAFRAAPDAFDLVVSDMSMPNITGDTLAKEITSIRPDIAIIICTGFSERLTEKNAEAVGIKGILMKPVVKSDMARMVRKVLEAGH